ncbi:hypothetical protein F2Q69_00016826 [Brassica cretica]|uniref:Uncharacterized protein n=1 Tax=Brassica cretica TaxID=69181 RepID=A0A8S9QYD7_BRACR|nr:hypothetical protein F2Q69_00016826 [Brassica cretica]
MATEKENGSHVKSRGIGDPLPVNTGRPHIQPLGLLEARVSKPAQEPSPLTVSVPTHGVPRGHSYRLRYGGPSHLSYERKEEAWACLAAAPAVGASHCRRERSRVVSLFVIAFFFRLLDTILVVVSDLSLWKDQGYSGLGSWSPKLVKPVPEPVKISGQARDRASPIFVTSFDVEFMLAFSPCSLLYLQDGFFPFVLFMKLGRVRGLFELYFSFEKNRREIEVYRSDCSFVDRLPPRFVRDCSGFGVVFIQLPAV